MIGEGILELRLDRAGVLINLPIGSPLIQIDRLLFPSITLGCSVSRLELVVMNSCISLNVMTCSRGEGTITFNLPFTMM